MWDHCTRQPGRVPGDRRPVHLRGFDVPEDAVTALPEESLVWGAGARSRSFRAGSRSSSRRTKRKGTTRERERARSVDWRRRSDRRARQVLHTSRPAGKVYAATGVRAGGSSKRANRWRKPARERTKNSASRSVPPSPGRSKLIDYPTPEYRLPLCRCSPGAGFQRRRACIYDWSHGANCRSRFAPVLPAPAGCLEWLHRRERL